MFHKVEVTTVVFAKPYLTSLYSITEVNSSTFGTWKLIQNRSKLKITYFIVILQLGVHIRLIGRESFFSKLQTGNQFHDHSLAVLQRLQSLGGTNWGHSLQMIFPE